MGPDEGLGDGDPELLGDLGRELEAGQRGGEGGVVADRHAVGLGLLDDAHRHVAAARGHDLRRARALVAKGRGLALALRR